jgi:Fe-S-cluster containining protein
MSDDTPTIHPDAGATEFDCQACGACCATFDVWLMEGDRDRFERSARLLPLTVIHRPGTATSEWRFLARDEKTGHCRALEGPLGKCRCTIYDDRPTLCREFEAGSEDCLEARQKHGIGQNRSTAG